MKDDSVPSNAYLMVMDSDVLASHRDSSMAQIPRLKLPIYHNFYFTYVVSKIGFFDEFIIFISTKQWDTESMG